MGDAPGDALQDAMADLRAAVGREVSPDIDFADNTSDVAATDEPPIEGDFGVEGPNNGESRGGGRVAPDGDFASGTSSTSIADKDGGALQVESTIGSRGLSRSLVDRLDAFVHFTPFGGSPIKEQKAWEEARVKYVHFPVVGSGARFDAAFMLPEAKEPGRKQTSVAATTRRSCDFCYIKERRCDANTPCATCKADRRMCVRSPRKVAKKRKKACDFCTVRKKACDGENVVL